MRSNKMTKRVMILIVGVAMIAGVTGLALADTVVVEPTQAIVEVYSAYGVEAATLQKASADLDASERRALHEIFGDDDASDAVNSVVFGELWDAVPDDDTVATITLAGKVYSIGSPDAF